MSDMISALPAPSSSRHEILERMVAESRAEVGAMALDRARLERQMGDLDQQIREARLRWQRLRDDVTRAELEQLEDKYEVHSATLEVLKDRIVRRKVELHKILDNTPS